MRGTLADVNPSLYLPAMGYLHVPGICEQGATGSRVNRLEAQTIANWFVDHRERLESLYGKPIHQLIGVVPQFAGQKEDRTSVMKGRGVSGPVALGGPRQIKKNK